jgi:DNA-binding beta-propeller fold protein YncE
VKAVNVQGLAILTALGIVLGTWNPLSRDGNVLLGQLQSSSAKYQVDPFWPKPLPEDWVTGNVGGTCVDKNDHVFIVNRTADPANLTDQEKEVGRPAPPVIEFDPDGSVVNSWGDPKIVPNGIHACYFDYEGDIWIGGNTDAIVQKYSHEGKLLLQIGTKGKFDTSDGTINGTALNTSHTLLNKPSSFAVDPSDGEVYITDGYGNRRVVVFDRNGNYIRQFGRQATKDETAQGVGGVFEEVVHCLVLSDDGLLYVADRGGRRIEVFDKLGNFKKNIWIQRRRADLAGNGAPWWILLSPDRGQKYLYVADGLDEMIWIVERESGKTVSGFGRLGHMAGEFTYLHTIAMNSKGDIFTGETIGGRRVQRFKAVGGPAPE